VGRGDIMVTITSTYKEHVEKNPEKIAIYTESEEINYQDWHHLVCKTANWLSSTLKDDRKVGILLPNGIPFLQLFAGTSTAGVIAIPFDVKWKPSELVQRLAIAKPSIVITTKELADRSELKSSEIIIWEEISKEIQETDSLVKVQSDEETLFYMGFTSGTTGIPKAFVRSHVSWVKSFSSSRNDFGLSGTDDVLIPGALVHSHFLYGAMSSLYFGGTVYLLNTFSPIQVMERIKRLPITVLYVVPTMIEAIASQRVYVLNPIKIISSGAKWNEESKNKIRQQFINMTMFEYYGASELSFVTYLNDMWNKEKPKSVGKVCEGVKFQIRDTIGNEVENGVIGKIYVKSPFVFSGYIQPDADVLQTLQDDKGWVTVDDLGYVDDEGFLYLVGREKSMIICGGENVYPEEVEVILLKHPNVKEAAVIGVEDAYWGQVPVAFIRGEVAKNELQKLCRQYLSTYKNPRKWYFVDDFPYTTGGKIARHQLQQRIGREVLKN
jgi:long-chain acyl-CoA synthetase